MNGEKIIISEKISGRIYQVSLGAVNALSLLLKEEGILIAGDTCTNVSGLGLSTVYEDPEVDVKSILKAAAFDFDKAVFGHGKPFPGSANMKMKEKFGHTRKNKV